MLLGHVGAVDHYEYRAVGDIVNTVSRIESLNKRLGTRILASAEVLDQLDGFLTREIGRFLLSGKTNPVTIHELLCHLEECSEQQRQLCLAFAQALRAYQKQSWEEAIERFQECLSLSRQDGPSRFYVEICAEYGERPPAEEWDGLVRLDKS
jgi:adenylate cyclase